MQRSREDSGKQRERERKEEEEEEEEEVYFRLDTLEMKEPREGAWATSGASLLKALMVREKKMFDLSQSSVESACISGCGHFVHCMV